MSLLGKILAFLNILGVGGFFYLATLTMAKHKAWQQANFRHDLIINGLPLNDNETDKQGLLITDELTDSILQELFPQGQRVKTQIEEVRRVQELVQSNLQQAAADKNKLLVEYARILLPFAVSNAERERLLALKDNLSEDKEKKLTAKEKAEALQQTLSGAIQPALEFRKPDPKKRPFDEAYGEAVHLARGEMKQPFVETLLRIQVGGKKFEEAVLAAELAGKPANEPFPAYYNQALDTIQANLKERLDNLFREALDGKRRMKPGAPPEAEPKVSNEQKRAIASLLFNLVQVLPAPGNVARAGSITDDPAYRRVITVVGVKDMSKVIDAQASTLQAIAGELPLEIAREQSAFALAQQSLLDHIRDRAANVTAQNVFLARKKDMATAKEKLVADRNEDLTYFTKKLEAARKETSDRFKELKAMRDELYRIRLQTRDATQLNQDYERQLNSLEELVGGGPAR